MRRLTAVPIMNQRRVNTAEVTTSNIQTRLFEPRTIWRRERLDLLKSGAFEFIRPHWSLPEMSRSRRGRPFVHGSFKPVGADSLLSSMCDADFMATAAISGRKGGPLGWR